MDNVGSNIAYELFSLPNTFGSSRVLMTSNTIWNFQLLLVLRKGYETLVIVVILNKNVLLLRFKPA